MAKNKKSPRKISLQEMIRRSVDSDPVTISDRETMRARWGIEYVSPKRMRQRKIMAAKNEFHQGHAVWEKSDGIWSCVQAGAGLEWLVGLEKITAKIELAKRGFEWEWL